MASLLREVFLNKKQENKAVFVPYLTAGFPSPKETVPLLLALEKGGADVIELGVPFSDPLADGTTIQEANTIAVENKISYADCLGFVAEARAKGLRAPVVLMGYVNPLLKYGIQKAVVDAKSAGVNGFIVVDLPLEEEPEFFQECKDQQLSFVPLVAPTSRDARIQQLVDRADSFVYCVSVAGVTGQRKDLPPELPAFIKRVQSMTQLPLAIGFGISTREHFVLVEQLAAGVVIGSAVIQTVKNAPEHEREEQLINFVKKIKGL